MYLDEFSMYQIEKLLGLHDRIKDCWLEDERGHKYPFIFSRKHRDSNYPSSDHQLWLIAIFNKFRKKEKKKDYKDQDEEKIIENWLKKRVKKHAFLPYVRLFS